MSRPFASLHFCYSRLTLSLLCLFVLPASLSAQGAWAPTNADFAYPRTLLRASEVPACIAWIDSHPEMHGFYQELYTDAWTQNVAQTVSNGERRSAAHIAKNCAFVLLLDRKPLLPTGLDTLTASEASTLRNKAIQMLEMINPNVEVYPDFGNYLWRANEITDNMIAFDLLKGAGVADSMLTIARRKLHAYATNYHTQVAFNTFGLGLTSLHVDNHTLRACGALGMSAVVLSDADSSDSDGRASVWIQTALYNIDNVLWRSNVRQSEPGQLAGYSEGPHYLRFGMRHCLEFFHAMGNFLPDTTLSVSFDGNTRTVRHPFHDPNFDLLWEWVMRIRLPDGRDPAMEDNFAQTHNADMALTEQARFRPTYHGARFNPSAPTTLWAQLHHSTDDVAADYIAAMTPYGAQPYPLLQALPLSGDLVMRSGWDTTSTYFHISAKNGRTRTSGNGHNHVDVTSFILHARGQELAIDPGYLKWERRDEVDGPTHHNMILVDGAGPPEASTGNAGDVDGFIEKSFSLGLMDYAEVRASYVGATIVRKPMFVRKDYILLADAIASPQAHSYTWQLNALGLQGGDSTHGSFALDSVAGSAVWIKNGVHLQAVVTAAGGLSDLTHVTKIHELRYDSMETHTMLQATRSGTGTTSFLAALIPFEADTPNVHLLCGPSCDAIAVRRGGYVDIAFAGNSVAASASGLAHDLAGNAVTSFYSETSAAAFSQWMMENGSLLTYGADTLGYATVPSNWALAVMDTASYEGHAGAAGTLYLYNLGFVPQSVLGWGVVQSWQYDSNLDRLAIVMSGAGRFTIHRDFILETRENAGLDQLRLAPNPAHAQVAVHVGTAGAGTWTLLDLQGRVLRAGNYAGGRFVIALDAFAFGLYFVRTVDEMTGDIKVDKLIVE
jgi:Heparinase II/III-like protein